jgi:heme-degrading monooxygenase HmoA
MFINVGRFRFRPLSEDECQRLVRSVDQEVSPIVRDSPGFRGFYVVRVQTDELILKDA